MRKWRIKIKNNRLFTTVFLTHNRYYYATLSVRVTSAIGLDFGLGLLLFPDSLVSMLSVMHWPIPNTVPLRLQRTRSAVLLLLVHCSHFVLEIISCCLQPFTMLVKLIRLPNVQSFGDEWLFTWFGLWTSMICSAAFLMIPSRMFFSSSVQCLYDPLFFLLDFFCWGWGGALALPLLPIFSLFQSASSFSSWEEKACWTVSLGREWAVCRAEYLKNQTPTFPQITVSIREGAKSRDHFFERFQKLNFQKCTNSH